MKKELSKKSPIYITKERFYELKHFVKQYHWFKEQVFYIEQAYPDIDFADELDGKEPGDPTYVAAMKALAYKGYIETIEKARFLLMLALKRCPEVDDAVGIMELIFNGAINDASYDVMQASMKNVMPISRKAYYFWLRVFFFKLDQVKIAEGV